MKTKINIILTSEAMLYNNIHEDYLLKYSSDINIIGGASNVTDLLLLLEKNKPDVLVLSLHLRGVKSGDIFGTLRKKYPDLKIIITTLTYYSECLKVYFLNKGAEGFLHENCFGENCDLLIDAIIRANNSLVTTCNHEPGEYYYALTNPNLKFTSIEYKILEMLNANYPIYKMVLKLGIAEKELKKHRLSVLKKMTVKNKTGLVMAGLTSGLIHVSFEPIELWH